MIENRRTVNGKPVAEGYYFDRIKYFPKYDSVNHELQIPMVQGEDGEYDIYYLSIPRDVLKDMLRDLQDE